jgi:bacterioferritin (cytochrome b1)
MQHQYMAVSLFSPGLKAEFQDATQELDHANRLAERIQQLGGVPIYEPREIAAKAENVGVVPEQGATLTEMVGEDLMLERQQMNYPAASCGVSEGVDKSFPEGVTPECFYRGSSPELAWIPA